MEAKHGPRIHWVATVCCYDFGWVTCDLWVGNTDTKELVHSRALTKTLRLLTPQILLSGNPREVAEALPVVTFEILSGV